MSSSSVILVGRNLSCRNVFLCVLLRCLELVLIKEVDQISLTGLQGHLTGKLMDAEFLDDLKQIRLAVQLRLGVFQEKLLSASFLAAGPSP